MPCSQSALPPGCSLRARREQEVCSGAPRGEQEFISQAWGRGGGRLSREGAKGKKWEAG